MVVFHHFACKGSNFSQPDTRFRLLITLCCISTHDWVRTSLLLSPKLEVDSFVNEHSCVTLAWPIPTAQMRTVVCAFASLPHAGWCATEPQKEYYQTNQTKTILAVKWREKVPIFASLILESCGRVGVGRR